MTFQDIINLIILKRFETILYVTIVLYITSSTLNGSSVLRKHKIYFLILLFISTE